MRQRKNETAEEYKARVAEYQKVRYLKMRQWIRDYKLSVGCKDCGYNAHYAALEFDHLIPRKGDRNQIVGWTRSLDKIKEEISKCDVVCANCHRIREENRRIATDPT